MGNPYIPRAHVHEWSEAIGRTQDGAMAARHLKTQRRLGRFIEENAAHMLPATRAITLWMVGVICHIFENAGGQMRTVTWAQIRAASDRVQGALAEILPTGDDMLARARGISWRAQPHILDEALMALFERPPSEEEATAPTEELLKVYLMMWVATEVLDENWRPAAAFQGEADYVHVPIDPRAPVAG